MMYLRASVVVLIVALVGVVYAQDKDKSNKDDKTAVKVRGRLPTYYKRLDLSPDQLKKIEGIRTDYKKRKDELLRQIDKLREDEKQSLEKVLTPKQREKLRQLREGKGK
jgi:Spy/CpxP family protein refolding chaperone